MREPADRGRRSEEPGMTGDPTQSPRVLIIDLADQETTVPGVDLRRCNAVTGLEVGPEADLSPPVVCHQLVELRVKRGAAGVREEEAEQNKTEVAVDRLQPRGILEWQCADGVLELRPSAMVPEEGQVRRQS